MDPPEIRTPSANGIVVIRDVVDPSMTAYLPGKTVDIRGFWIPTCEG